MVTAPEAARPFRLAVTADLHFGTRDAVDRGATVPLVAGLCADPPDLLVLAGDIGAGDEFDACLALFDGLTCRKALVPGNHDVWVRSDDARGDSWAVYDDFIPRVAAAHGFHVLDRSPLVFPEVGLAVVGSMNWYDYSWGRDRLPAAWPDYAERLKSKRFTRGRHNDAVFVRWPFDDPGFTRHAVEALEAHVAEALARVPAAVLVTHHPPFYGLAYPRDDRDDPDGLLWDAFGGNARLEALIEAWGGRVPLAFCGHTHHAREASLGACRGFNVGGDYHFKRLLRVEWPTGAVTAEEFHPAS